MLTTILIVILIFLIWLINALLFSVLLRILEIKRNQKYKKENIDND